jgi:hypothetical protein
MSVPEQAGAEDRAEGRLPNNTVCAETEAGALKNRWIEDITSSPLETLTLTGAITHRLIHE